MSLFDRVRSIFGKEPAAEASEASEASPPDALPDEVARAAAQPAVPDSALARLRASTSDDAALDAYAKTIGEVGESRANEEARRLLDRGGFPALRVRLARSLDARGDDAAVEAVLSRMPEEGVPQALLLEAWSRRAEALERRGDVEGAQRCWERVLARDVSYGNARERAQRLRGDASAGVPDAGATVMAEGALTRGRYRVQRELGRGGAGTVFLADDVSLDRRVALKVYHRRGRAERERLLHEAKVPASLEHPGVVRILDVDLTLFAIAMEWTDGSLKEAIHAPGASLEARLSWAREMTDTLLWIHARGLVHRDVKPSNVLLRGGHVVFTDFGLAVPAGAPPSIAGRGEGSAGYMPDEQRLGAPASFAMDVHALGVSFAELFPEPAPPPPLAALIAAMRSADAADRPPLDAVRDALARRA